MRALTPIESSVENSIENPIEHSIENSIEHSIEHSKEESHYYPICGIQGLIKPNQLLRSTTRSGKGRLLPVRRNAKRTKKRRRVGTLLRLTTTLPSPSSSALHTSPPSNDGQSEPKEDHDKYPNRWHTHRYRRRRHNRRRSSKQISSAAQIHCDNALLERLRKGQKSDSPRWRKRTKRAAASFGFRLEEDNMSRLMYATLTPEQNDTSNVLSTDATTTIDRLSPLKRRRLPKKPKLTPEQYQVQKTRWAARYTSLPTLRSTFGTNRNKFWGDFDPATTRRLYNTLLPRALLGLYEMGLWSPNDLAPLAYEARITAKKYARERCVVPARAVAMLYDGFRSWRDWGTWSVEGMSWEQVWYKYETQILEEMMLEDGLDHRGYEEEGEEVTAQICLRILERSCITNERINQLLLGEDEDEEEDENHRKPVKRRRNAERYLGMIAAKLDMDMQELMEENERQFAGGVTITTVNAAAGT